MNFILFSEGNFFKWEIPDYQCLEVILVYD